MIDRSTRDEVIATFEAYLNDRITAFQFDDQLQDISTEDETLRKVISEVWCHYDDIKDHKVVLSKPEWNYFQRLLLLLRSDRELIVIKRRQWFRCHTIAAVSFSAFMVLACLLGWGFYLLLLTIPFGGVVTLIERQRLKHVPDDSALIPFQSYSQISWLRRQVPDFTKRPYPEWIDGRRIRSKFSGVMMGVLSVSTVFFWLTLSPLALLLQAIPHPESCRRVILR